MGLVPCPHFFGSLALEKNTADAGGFFQGLFVVGRLRFSAWVVVDFYHKCLYEEQLFVYPQNCYKKQ
jgi:hypothetical protein